MGDTVSLFLLPTWTPDSLEATALGLEEGEPSVVTLLALNSQLVPPTLTGETAFLLDTELVRGVARRDPHAIAIAKWKLIALMRGAAGRMRFLTGEGARAHLTAKLTRRRETSLSLSQLGDSLQEKGVQRIKGPSAILQNHKLLQYLGATTPQERGLLHFLLTESPDPVPKRNEALQKFGIRLSEDGKRLITLDIEADRADETVDKNSGGFRGLPEETVAPLRTEMKKLKSRLRMFRFFLSGAAPNEFEDIAIRLGLTPAEIRKPDWEMVEGELKKVMDLLEHYLEKVSANREVERKTFLIAAVWKILRRLETVRKGAYAFDLWDINDQQALITNLYHVSEGLETILYPRVISMYWLNRVWQPLVLLSHTEKKDGVPTVAVIEPEDLPSLP